MSSQKFIILKSNNGEEFKLEEAIAMRSQVLKNIIQDADHASNVIPLSNVDGKTMSKVIEYWKKHSEEGVSADQLKDFDKDFLKVHHSIIHDILSAANNLDDKELLDVMIQEVVDRIKGKPPEEIREEFDMENDFTPEEEKEVRKEKQWANI